MARLKKTALSPLQLNPTLWRALSVVVSKDEIRKLLTHVHVRNARTWEATDGHCAVQVLFDADVDLEAGIYDPKVTLARIKAGVNPEKAAPFALHDDWHFPDVDQVMPKGCEGYAMRPDVCLNPCLVSRVCDAISGIMAAVCGRADAPVAWHIGTEDLEAVLAVAKVPGATVRAAIMPMRSDVPRIRPTADTFNSDAADADRELAKQRIAYLESVVADLRADVTRLTDLARDAQDAADTDAADAERVRQECDDLRAEVNALRHLRPKGEPAAPILLTRPVVRA